MSGTKSPMATPSPATPAVPSNLSLSSSPTLPLPQSSPSTDGASNKFPPPKAPKPTSKEERRALQEAQRAAKAAKKADAPGASQPAKKTEPTTPQQNQTANQPARRPSAQPGDDSKKAQKQDKKSMVPRTKVAKEVGLLSHLPQYEKETSLTMNIGLSQSEIHPAIIQLGLHYASGAIVGANARCLAMLEAFKQWIMDYTTPPYHVLSRDMEQRIKPLFQFLTDCRPHSVTMGVAIKHLKQQIVRLPPTISEAEAKEKLVSAIDEYIQDKMDYAMTNIVSLGSSLIKDGDVVLTYGCSSSVEGTIKAAHAQGTQFRVIVVDSRPKFEGRELLQRLLKAGVPCSYTLLTGLSYIIREATKVFIGAAAMLHNGSVLSRVGTAVVAMVANSVRVPVLVCCETYKFCERVQLDSICHNELGDPDQLARTHRPEGDVLADWRENSNLKLLNLVYDVTPPKFINMVISDVGCIPASSVPVVVRERKTDPSLGKY